MSTQRLNAAEKDLEKFVKFLALKSTQVVVQSRLGEKIQTQCHPLATGNDWFNIVIQDHPDVSAETKRALAMCPGESILQRLPLCIEISLKTAEGDQMVLEVWSLDLHASTNAGGQQQQQPPPKEDKEKATPNGGTTNSMASNGDQPPWKAACIYNRMGILLKSLISLTRATPAYKISRRQCPDSYGIYYRIYVDRPQVHTLGEGHKNVRIGQLNTIVGVLSMSCAYRTKMAITPTTVQTRTTDANGIMLKSDHFRPTTDSTAPLGQPLNGTALKKVGGGGGGALGGERKIIDIEKPLRPGAFTDVGKLRQYTEEDFVLPETPPFEWLLQRTRADGGGSLESLNRKCNSASPPVTNGNPAAHSLVNGNAVNNNNNNANLINNNNNNNNHSNNNNVTGFKSFEKDDRGASTQSQSPIKSLLLPAPQPATRHSSAPNLPPATHAHPPPHDDDNLLKELNFPFASPSSHVNDLAKFYRDCYHAPPLCGLSELQAEGTAPVAGSSPGCAAVALAAVGSADSSVVDDLSRQLEQFETSLEDYDKLVSQFGLAGSSSTGSRSSGGLQMSN